MEYLYESHIHFINISNPIFIKKTHSQVDGYIHWHENIELLYIVDGNFSVSTDARELESQAGDLFVMTPGSVHGTKCKENHGTYICAIIDQDFMKSLGFYTNTVNIRRRIRDDEIKKLFERIMSDMENESEYSKSSIRISVLNVLLILFQKYSAPCYSEKSDTAKIQLVKKATKYIREHFTEDFSLDDIAKHCGYTKFYICRVFKEVSGNSIIHYLHNMRINEAKIMITKGNTTITELSARYGFSSPSYFGKIFKKFVGCSPLEYKMQKNQAATK